MIYVIAGHGGTDPGAMRGPLKEADMTLELAALIEAESACKVLREPPKASLVQTIQWLVARLKPNDILLDLHFNTGGGTGVETFTPAVPSSTERILASNIGIVTSEVLGLRNRGVKSEALTRHKRLGIFRNVAHAALLEVCFLDNPTDMAAYQKHKHRLAKEIAAQLNIIRL